MCRSIGLLVCLVASQAAFGIDIVYRPIPPVLPQTPDKVENAASLKETIAAYDELMKAWHRSVLARTCGEIVSVEDCDCVAPLVILNQASKTILISNITWWDKDMKRHAMGAKRWTVKQGSRMRPIEDDKEFDARFVSFTAECPNSNISWWWCQSAEPTDDGTQLLVIIREGDTEGHKLSVSRDILDEHEDFLHRVNQLKSVSTKTRQWLMNAMGSENKRRQASAFFPAQWDPKLGIHVT